MKNIRLAFIALFVIILIIISSFLKPPAGAIKGTVNPADAGLRAEAIFNVDTSRSVRNITEKIWFYDKLSFIPTIILVQTAVYRIPYFNTYFDVLVDTITSR